MILSNICNTMIDLLDLEKCLGSSPYNLFDLLGFALFQPGSSRTLVDLVEVGIALLGMAGRM